MLRYGRDAGRWTMIGMFVFSTSCAHTFETVARDLPSDVDWVLTRNSLSWTLSQLGAPRFVAKDAKGRILAEDQFTGLLNLNTPECASIVDDVGTYWSPGFLVNANNVLLSRGPAETDEVIVKLNQSKLGHVQLVNTEALWFLQNGTGGEIHGKLDPRILPLEAGATLENQSVVLLALIATARFDLSPGYVACLKAGFASHSDLQAAYERFRNEKTRDGEIVTTEARLYTGAVLGVLVGLEMNGVDIGAKATGTVEGVAVTVKLSHKNVSLRYQQYGIMSEGYGLDGLLEPLKASNAPGALQHLRKHAEKMAVIGIVPERLDIAIPAAAVPPSDGEEP